MIKRSIDDLPLKFHLHDPLDPQNIADEPGFIGDITAKIARNFRMKKRGRGGWWLATSTWEGDDYEMLEFYVDGLMRELRVMDGAEEIFRAFTAKMRLTMPNGDVFERDWAQVANKTRSIYTRIGDNEFTNGSAESGAWADYGTPTTNEQSTDWVTDGVYAEHIVADSAGDGAIIQTGISLVANKGKQAQVSVNIIAGTWVFEIYRTDTDEALARRVEDAEGKMVLQVSISEDNTYAGTIGARVYLDDASASGEIYCDAAILQDAPYRAESAWYEAADSQHIFGVKELVLLLAGASDEAAGAKAATELRKRSWAHSLPPTKYKTLRTGETMRLDLTFCGYVFTLSNLHVATPGTDEMSDHVTAMLSQAEFVDAGVILSNATSYQIDDIAPITLWAALEAITIAGDASGNRWECGVYGGRTCDYLQVSEAALYTWENGQLYALDKSVVEPWRARPGYVTLKNMPLGPGQISGYETDDPRVVYMFEIEFSVPDWLAGQSGLAWIREPYE